MRLILLVFLSLLITVDLPGQNVGIGTINPASSAALDVTSTTSGLLPPRMTFAQRNSISNPATGLIIWCIDCDELQVYNGTIWKNMMGGAASVISPPFVTICNQDWMVRNLDVSTYRNGDPIPKVTDNAEWISLTSGAYCYYNNDSITYAATYGKLYNWYAVNDSRGLAPENWHVPTDIEWTTLSTCLGGNTIAGGPMKETGYTHWSDPNTGATNLCGFTALPGGYRYSWPGNFESIYTSGFWWSSLEYDPTNGWCRYVVNTNDDCNSVPNPKTCGFSVRCLRD